jgi:iron complex outermembrane receptor protein
MRLRAGFLLSASLAGCLCVSATAFASENSAAAEDAAAETGSGPNDIIVNGLRVDEGQNKVTGNGALGAKSLLDTPYSITVVDREDIAKRQATSIAQIFVNDPSVFSFATAGTTNWWGTQIRGLGVRNYYIDDVPLLLYWGGDFALESVETVEALKGLSGFMYGFGAPGGTISYRSKRPTDAPLLTTEIGYRTGSDFFAHLDAGGPLTQDGRLGYRVNLAGEKGTTYNDASNNRWLASLALEYAFSPDVKWYATATYEDSKLKREPFQIYWDGSLYADTVLPKPTYDYKKLNIDNSYYKARTLVTATGLDWKFADGWSAKLTYGYTSKLHHSNKMFVYMLNKEGDYEGYAYNFAELDQNHFAQAMVQGAFETGPVRHAIVAGASYMANDAFFGADSHWSNDFNGNIYENQDFLVTRDISWSTEGFPYRERQRAVFLSDTLYLGDHVQAIAGVRHTRYHLLDDDGDPAEEGGYRTSATSPTFALILKPAPWASLYGSYVESLEPGSRVGADYANFGEILPATVSKQYEMGVKIERGPLSLTGAAFRIERVNTAMRFIDGLRYATQDGLTVYKGIEAIANWRVSQDFRLGLGAIHLDPRLRRLDVDENGDPSPYEGKTPAEAARWQVTANAEYYVAAVPGLSIHGNVRYFGKAPTDDTNFLYIPSRTLANAGFQYQTLIGGRKVGFTGNVNNLFNKKYWGLGNIGEGINGSLSATIYW